MAGSRLLEAALSGVMPGALDFPFAVRLTADVLALDGSAVSAAVSSGSLALIGAGVPISAPVAGASFTNPYVSLWPFTFPVGHEKRTRL